jgi:hypothetical protein
MLQISAAKMGSARRSKIASKNSKNSGLNKGVEFFLRESEVAGGRISGGPGGPTPCHGTS